MFEIIKDQKYLDSEDTKQKDLCQRDRELYLREYDFLEKRRFCCPKISIKSRRFS